MIATKTIDAEYGLEKYETISNTESSFAELSAKYNNMINVLFTKNHIHSTQEVQQIKSRLQSVRNDMGKIEEEHNFFDKVAVPLMLDQVHRKEKSMKDLQTAMFNKEISKNSYEQWVEWLNDDNRNSTEKTDSMNSNLRDYLDARRDLATERENARKEPQYAALSQSTDPHVRSLVKKLDDIDYFLNALSFTERKSLIVDVLATFDIAEADQKLFEVFSKELDGAVGKYISADAKNRWIARFNHPSASRKDREQFVTKEFPKYVNNWKEVQKKYEKLHSNPVAATLTKKDVQKIDVFHSPAKFLALGYKAKLNLVNEADNAVTAKAEGKEKKLQEIQTIVHTAARAGYVSEYNTGSLVSRMMKANRSPEEVEKFVQSWAKVRFRYDEVERKINDTKIPQGFHRLSKTAFLSKKWKARELYVQEAEERLDMESRPIENTPFSNAKGKVRNALDAKNWPEAELFLQNAWKLASSEKEQLELKSMERYLHAFKDADNNENAEESQSASEAVREISSCLNQLPTPMRPIYEEALKRNAGCVWTVGVIMACNPKWCLDRGYLPRDLDSVRDTARTETAQRIKRRQGHSKGTTHAMVDDFDKPAINEEPTGAQNCCVSSSKASLIAETANANQDNMNYWYWTNVIVKGVAAGEYENVANNLRHKITRAARTLEANGTTYESAITTHKAQEPSKSHLPRNYSLGA